MIDKDIDIITPLRMSYSVVCLNGGECGRTKVTNATQKCFRCGWNSIEQEKRKAQIADFGLTYDNRTGTRRLIIRRETK